jgi:2-amino-4-hydroxy-6-hydroxymethyldihydropteridine diphosphokinase
MTDTAAHLAHRTSVEAYIALGANLGDAKATVLLAVQALASIDGTALMATSSLYRTAPIDSSGDDYINAVAKIFTSQPSYALLSALQKIEQQAGRERPYRNAPRTLDLDLLLYGDAQIQSERLTVPHPRMWQRAFVLAPLREMAPERVSQAQLEAVSDQAIQRID